jgi:hypothetical protein
MNRRSATFEEFKDYTLAVARGERMVDPSEPKVWCEEIEGSEPESPAAAATENSLYIHSVLRERIVEHVFVGHALQRLWERKAFDIEVLRSEFDAGGYDLVMSYGKIVRHIQFKSVIEGGKTGRVNISLKLAEKPSGCVILLVVSPKNLEIKSYRWFGGDPGKPLTDIKGMKVAKQPKANANGIKLEKPGHRVVPLRKFTPPLEIDEVLDRLFGRLP